jgi:hypothetical protein
MKRLVPLVFALVSVAGLAAGCKQPTICHALGACGGNAPIGIKPNTDGNWVIAPGHASCSEDLYIPASDPRLSMAAPTTAGTANPEPAVYDWCSLLVAGPGSNIEVNPPRLYEGGAEYGFVTLKFQPDGHFSSGITLTGTFVLELPAQCVTAFGATGGQLDPTDPTSPVVDVCARLQGPLYNSAINTGAYQNLQCAANTAQLRATLGLDGAADPNGCLCRYDLDETGGPAGTYALLNQNTIIDYPDAVNSNYPQQTTFCLQGDDLQLTGADGAYLFDQKGLRTLDLVRGCLDDGDCASGHCDTTTQIAAKGICQ